MYICIYVHVYTYILCQGLANSIFFFPDIKGTHGHKHRGYGHTHRHKKANNVQHPHTNTPAQVCTYVCSLTHIYSISGTHIYSISSLFTLSLRSRIFTLSQELELTKKQIMSSTHTQIHLHQYVHMCVRSRVFTLSEELANMLSGTGGAAPTVMRIYVYK